MSTRLVLLIRLLPNTLCFPRLSLFLFSSLFIFIVKSYSLSILTSFVLFYLLLTLNKLLLLTRARAHYFVQNKSIIGLLHLALLLVLGLVNTISISVCKQMAQVITFISTIYRYD